MGLVQRVIEESGISTITLSPMYEVTAAVGAPRIAAIERPFSQTVASPGDVVEQRAVLQATLEALESATTPGEITYLSFAWHEPRLEAIKNSEAHRPPPIVKLLKRKPWLVGKFFRGKLPKP